MIVPTNSCPFLMEPTSLRPLTPTDIRQVLRALCKAQRALQHPDQDTWVTIAQHCITNARHLFGQTEHHVSMRSETPITPLNIKAAVNALTTADSLLHTKQKPLEMHVARALILDAIRLLLAGQSASTLEAA